jgi:hypothetical protein
MDQKRLESCGRDDKIEDYECLINPHRFEHVDDGHGGIGGTGLKDGEGTH